MKTFKQFQEGLFDFLPKGKTLNRSVGGSLTNQEKQRYKMPIQKQPTGGSKMPMPPQPTTKPDPYKTTLA